MSPERAFRRVSARRAGAAWVCAAVMTAAAVSATAAVAVVPAPPPGTPAVENAPSSLTGLEPTLPHSVFAASSAPGYHWKPERAKYGTASRDDITIAGAGGTPISVNEIYPTLADGKPAPGRFPVVMTMTPYGKGQGGSSKPGSEQKASPGSILGGTNNYLVQRGYINVVEDVRGTGDSGGSWSLFAPVQQQDAIDVLHWAAKLPHSDGRVGTYGPSYMGIDQVLLAGTVGRHSPLKAIFPLVPADSIYRDTAFMGGLVDSEFDITYLGLTGALNTANPVADTASDSSVAEDLLQVELDHANGLQSFDAATLANVLSGGPEDYNGSFWQQRAPQGLLAKIVSNHIPAYILGGEFDIFQNGEPLDYAELENAYDHRSTYAPMSPTQKTTGRYQLLVGPWEHLNGSSVSVDELELEWFDTWLKHEHTGMAQTKTPVHYYNLGTGKFSETSRYPFTRTKATRFYFGAGKSLTTRRPSSSGGSDTIVFSPTGVPCSRPVDQWALGGVSIPAHSLDIYAPCADNNNLSEIGPWQKTYQTAPLPRAATIAGPMNATVYMKATTTQTELVAEVNVISPDGSSFPVTEGALLGSARAIEQGRSWKSGGMTYYPYHPFTQASAKPVVKGALTKYQIEIFPTYITLPKGDRLSVTISTADVPHLIPTPAQLTQMLGGVYTVEHTAKAPSSLTVLLRH